MHNYHPVANWHPHLLLSRCRRRCAMHGFNLVLKSVLSDLWAEVLAFRSQQVVTYFRSSHKPLADLHEVAAGLEIKEGLRSSGTTRFTSTYSCTSSVMRHKLTFDLLLQRNSTNIITSQDVLNTLEDATFWVELAKLNKLLTPISKVVMVVQGDRATMAGVCRCWLYLAKELGGQLCANMKSVLS